MLKLINVLHLMGLLLKLKWHGVMHGRRLRGNRVAIKNVGKIVLGNCVSLNSYPDASPHRTTLMAHCREAVISIADHCNLNGTVIHCRSAVTIGSYCMFGPGSQLVDNDSHRISPDIRERRQPPESLPIVIHDNVWIGMNALILKGVEIGENAMVAANSVVTRDVAANTLVAGNPARVIKSLLKNTGRNESEVPVECR